MFMVFHSARERRPYLIAFFAILLLAGILLTLLAG